MFDGIDVDVINIKHDDDAKFERLNNIKVNVHVCNVTGPRPFFSNPCSFQTRGLTAFPSCGIDVVWVKSSHELNLIFHLLFFLEIDFQKIEKNNFVTQSLLSEMKKSRSSSETRARTRI